MRRLAQVAAAIGLAAACLAGSVPASFAARAEGWVKVELKFKTSGKTTVVFGDVPVPKVKDLAQFCERDLFWEQNGLAYMFQQGRAELANAKLVGIKCVTEAGQIKWSKQPTDLLPQPQPLPDLAGVKLFFADANGKEVSKVYQERRDHMSSADCEKRFSALVSRYKQMARQDARLGKMTFLRGECVVLKTFK